MITAALVKELRDKTGAGMMDCKRALVETNGDIEAATIFLRKNGINKAEKKASRIAAEGLANTYTEAGKAIILEINAETDFVSKNEEFKSLVSTISKTLVNSEVSSVEEADNEKAGEETIVELVISKTAIIGEKLSFRRFERISKEDNQSFGEYLHMGGKIAVLTLVDGTDAEVAKDIAMHVAASKPKYIGRDEVPSDEIEKEREILKEQAINEGKPADIAEKMVEGRINKYYKEVCALEQPFIKDGDMTVKAYLESKNSRLIKFIRYEVGEGLEKKEDNFAEEVMNQVK